MKEKIANSGAEAPEPVTKIVIYVRDKNLPDEVKDVLRDPFEKERVGEILEALLKVQIERGTISKTIFIPPVKNPKALRIHIRRKDLAWLNETKGSMSRPGWVHHIIEAYKKAHGMAEGEQL